MPRLAGRLRDDQGVAISGATVNVYTQGTTTPVVATDTTDSNGDWAIGPGEAGDAALTAAEDLDSYNVEAQNGTERIWYNAHDEVNYKSLVLWNADANEYALQVVRTENAVSLEVATFDGLPSTNADNDESYISFRQANDAATAELIEIVRLTWVATDVSDGTEDGRLDIGIMTAGVMADELQLDGTALSPSTNDGLALGTTALGYADLHLATGAVINWANGEITITETDGNTLTIAGVATVLDLAAGILELNNAVRFDTGVAIVAATYSIGRDADGTNQLHLNVPTGATFELSVNDVVEMTLSATAVNFQSNSITTTGGGSLTGTWTDLGTVTTVDINGGTVDGTTQASGTINGPIAAGGTWTAAAAWTLPAYTLGGTVTLNGQSLSGIATGSWVARWSGGTAITAAQYEITRDADATNQMHFNVPTGATFEWSVNDVAQMTLSASTLALPVSGSIISFNAGDVTITHAANQLQIDGGDFIIVNANGVVIGHTAQLTIAGATAEFQVIGTTGEDGALSLWRGSANSGGTNLIAGKSRNTTPGSFTIVAADDSILSIIAAADDGTDYATPAAQIDFAVDGTPGANDMPGRIVFSTTADNAAGVTERLRIDSAGRVLVNGGTFQSNSATEIGICVTNETLTVGSEGSAVIPYLSQTGAAFTDGIGGNVNGAIGVNYDSDTGPTSTIEVRVEGSWLSVAVTGYSINRRIPFDAPLNREVAWWHDSQIKPGYIDESVCIVCGEQMRKGDQVTMWANYDRPRDVHAAFGHLHLERDPHWSSHEDRISALEQANDILRGQLARAGIIPEV